MTARILVADDDEPIVELVATILEQEGHIVERAYDGRQSVDRLDRDGLDLLITDYMMPHHTGLELIDHLAARPGVAVPVILMSAVRPTPPAPPPPNAFLAKPFDLDALLALVARMLNA